VRKKMMWCVCTLLFVLSTPSQNSAQARPEGRRQAAGAPGKAAPPNMPGTFTFIPKADTEALMGPTRGDRPARVVNIGDHFNFGAFILHLEPIKTPLR
jgi:hypothetical protein